MSDQSSIAQSFTLDSDGKLVISDLELLANVSGGLLDDMYSINKGSNGNCSNAKICHGDNSGDCTNSIQCSGANKGSCDTTQQ